MTRKQLMSLLTFAAAAALAAPAVVFVGKLLVALHTLTAN